MKESDKPVIVVTGSSGYLGAAVVKRLHEKYRVVGLDRHSPPHPPHQAECICFDITDQASVDKALPCPQIVLVGLRIFTFGQYPSGNYCGDAYATPRFSSVP